MRAAIGQDSHRFEEQEGKPLVLGGVVFPEERKGFLANSDGDVLLHALTNAVSGITGRNILGAPADRMCRAGITDSRAYLAEALKDLDAPILHVSFSVEGSHPKIAPRADEIRASVAGLLGILPGQVGITATTGEGLTDFGKGLGVSVFCIITVGDRNDI